MSGDVRMRGQLIGSAEGAVVRVKLDLRLRLENQEPVVWMAISDPMMGLPVGRLKITADSVHGFSPVLKKYGAEPVSDLSKWGVGVTLTAGDLQQALMGLPMAMPTGACHVDQGADTWTLTFQSMRDNEVADITLVFERGIRPRLRSQQIDAGGETVLIAYALSSSLSSSLPSSLSSSTLPSLTAASSSMFTAWTLTVQGRGQLTFKLQHIDWDADLTFPYNLPSGYARMAL